MRLLAVVVAGIAACAAPDVASEDTAARDTAGTAACGGEAGRMDVWPGGPEWDAQFTGSSAAPTGWGVAVADLDGDGLHEIFLPQPGQDALFRVGADGTVTAIGAEGREGVPRVPAEAVSGRGAVAADYDGDGALDLYVTNHGPDALLHNDGTGWFEDVTAAAGIATEEAASTSAAWADMDGDGDLDLAVAHTAIGDDPVTKEVISGANALWENLGDGTFRDVSDRLVGDAVGQVAFVLGWVEANGDGAPDLYAVNDKGHRGHANALAINDGTGRFVDVSAASGVGVSMQGMGLAAADLDGDARDDLLGGPQPLRGGRAGARHGGRWVEREPVDPRGLLHRERRPAGGGVRCGCAGDGAGRGHVAGRRGERGGGGRAGDGAGRTALIGERRWHGLPSVHEGREARALSGLRFSPLRG